MLPEHIKLDFDKAAKVSGLNEKQKQEVEKRLIEQYQASLISPGEAIGIITAESFGEPSTQMSISYFEKVIVKINDTIKIVKIGEFVDLLMGEYNPVSLNNSEVLPLHHLDVYVPSLNNNEKIEWKKVVECSRHKSPDKLMRLITKSGRKIVATDNHSFVTRINNAVVPIVGNMLKVGDRIPSIRYLPEHCVDVINVSDFVELPSIESGRVTREYRPTKLIPSKLELNWDFGWFVGAYLAEGCATTGQLSISNLDDSYIKNAKNFISQIGLDFEEKKHHRGFADSRDLVISSSLLAKFIQNSCGAGSDNKKVPEFAYSAKEDFVRGLLRGYFDGDGNFTVSRKMIRVSSNSEELLDGIKLLLTRFGIFAFKSRDNKQNYLIVPYKYAPVFLEKIGSDIGYKFDSLVKLAKLADKNMSVNYRDHNDAISGFDNLLIDISRELGLHTRYVNSATKRQKIGRTALLRHIVRFEQAASEKNIDLDLKMLKQMYDGDVVWDEIEKIDYIDSPSKYVYDFSVPGLETFTTFDGIITHNTLNTFHFAGVAEMNITVGLPRLIEVFDARKTPSTPKMEIYLKQRYARTTEQVREVAMRIKETKLGEVAADFQINLPKMRIEVDLSKKKLRDLGLKASDVLEKIKKELTTLEVKEDKGLILLTPKTKELEMSELYKLKEKAKNISVMGLRGITQVLPVKGEGEFVIHCAGSNLKDALQMEEVDATRTKTNDIFEIAEVLGIEAARVAIINEAKNVISDQGLDINIRHIMLLSDVMTRMGSLKGVTRTGITGEKESVLAKASFETPIKHLIDASLTGEVDELNSVVENVILNQPVPLGTGLPTLVAKGNKK